MSCIYIGYAHTLLMPPSSQKLKELMSVRCINAILFILFTGNLFLS